MAGCEVDELIQLNSSLSARLTQLQRRIIELQTAEAADFAETTPPPVTNIACCLLSTTDRRVPKQRLSSLQRRFLLAVLHFPVAVFAFGLCAVCCLGLSQLSSMSAAGADAVQFEVRITTLQITTTVLLVTGLAAVVFTFASAARSGLLCAVPPAAEPPATVCVDSMPVNSTSLGDYTAAPPVVQTQAQQRQDSDSYATPPRTEFDTLWGDTAAHTRLQEACAVVDTLAAGNHSAQARHAAEVALLLLSHGDPPPNLPLWRLHARLARVCFRRVIVDKGELQACAVKQSDLALPVVPRFLDVALTSPLLIQSVRTVSQQLQGGAGGVQDWAQGSWLGRDDAPKTQHDSIEQEMLSKASISEHLHRGKRAAADGISSSGGACPLSHKMAALCGNQLASMEGTAAQAAFAPVFREHLEAALRVSNESADDALHSTGSAPPQDAEAFHMLGRWGYELSRLSWLERRAAAALYGELPEVSPAAVRQWLAHAAKAPPPLRDLEGVLGFARMLTGDAGWMPPSSSAAGRLCSRQRWLMNELWLGKCEHDGGDTAAAVRRVKGVLRDCEGGGNTPEEAYVAVDAAATLAKWGGQ